MQQAKHVLWLIHRLRWSDQWVFEKQARDGKFPLHYVLSQKCDVSGEGLVVARELLKILLEANPDSARCCFSGRLPLHMALENGWPCHDLLLSLFPEALNTKDPTTELYPFQSSALSELRPPKIPRAPSSSGPVDILDLDITYELLRANPSHAVASRINENRVHAHA